MIFSKMCSMKLWFPSWEGKARLENIQGRAWMASSKRVKSHVAEHLSHGEFQRSHQFYELSCVLQTHAKVLAPAAVFEDKAFKYVK
jgi:hypothetical protein